MYGLLPEEKCVPVHSLEVWNAEPEPSALETDALGNFKFPEPLLAMMMLEKANLGGELWHQTVLNQLWDML